jgi:P-type Ca2+ transporter type 2C
MVMKQYYQLSVEEVLAELKTTHRGLSQDQAQKRLIGGGYNRIRIKATPLWKKIAEPFLSVFMLILIIAVVISAISHELIDGLIIGSIILITAIIYYVQRFSTERVLRALERHSQQQVGVYRDNKIIRVNSENIVPGDIVLLAEGEKVPADMRIITSNNVRVDEALLTGESLPVEKHAAMIASKKEIYRQANMLFQGSYVVAGSLSGVVVATGNATEFGQLAALAKGNGLHSPVKRKIDKLISQIVIAVASISFLVFLLSFYRGMTAAESLRLVLTFSVSAIPESLPVAISVVLVLGMRRLAQYKALVRNMSAIENIGIITTIATDKTGTLTKNQLRVQDVWSLRDENDLQQIAASLSLVINQNDGVMNDPLDTAFQLFAHSYGAIKPKTGYTLEKNLPFDLQQAKSGNIYRVGKTYEVYLKGSPEKIVAMCRLSQLQQKKISKQIHSLTGSGYRVIAVCRNAGQKTVALELKDLPSHGFEFICLVAVADELREESKPSIFEMQGAGVSVRMITGDHFETAFAIGKKLGLVEHRGQVYDCSSIQTVSKQELRSIVAKTKVFSRVLPEYKYKILGVLKETEIAAMTGDGVNDVPALSNAHIGIAMGSGSQIAKEAGDIVLLDDNFRSIAVALREGRVIYDNIRRMLYYLLSTNLGEVLTTVAALVVGMPLPLLPVQILWTNLGTDTAMVIPLGLEPAENDVMKRKPRSPRAPIISKLVLSRMLLVAVTMAIVALTAFYFALQQHSETYARTIVFSALVAMQLTNAVNARSMWSSVIYRIKVVNKTVVYGLIAALGLYYLAVFGPMATYLQLEPLAMRDMLYIWVVGIAAITFVNEIHKFVVRTMATRRSTLDILE